MNPHRVVQVFVRPVFLAALIASSATAAERTALVAIGIQPAMEKIFPAVERATGHKVTVTYGLTPQFVSRLKAGEAYDLVILTRAGVAELQSSSLVDPGLVRPLASDVMGMAVREGAT